MCVIIVKPSGASLPTYEELIAAYTTHPHGMGFVSTHHRYKGLNFDAFCEHLAKVKVDEECIIHFRFATHGSVCRSNCHPFREGNVWFAHNGILDIEPIGNMTDSETAFKTIIMPAIRRYGLRHPMTSLIIKDIIGYSKFAFMQRGKVALFGNFSKYEGRYYSNTRHLYARRYTHLYDAVI